MWPGTSEIKMSAPMREQFRVAVERVLNSWTVLKLAVSHGFGGADSEAKAEWLVYAVDQWFAENTNIDPYEVEDFLEDVLNTEFDTIADDGSLPQIAQMICGFYKLCQDGSADELKEKLDKLPKPAVKNSQPLPGANGTVESSSEDEPSENGMDPDPPPHVAGTDSSTPPASNNDNQDSMEMEVTEDDGWTTVGKKGKRR